MKEITAYVYDTNPDTKMVYMKCCNRYSSLRSPYCLEVSYGTDSWLECYHCRTRLSRAPERKFESYYTKRTVTVNEYEAFDDTIKDKLLANQKSYREILYDAKHMINNLVWRIPDELEKAESVIFERNMTAMAFFIVDGMKIIKGKWGVLT